MRFLQIVVKNTSELDFSLPLLWSLAADKKNEIFVLYTSLNKSQFTRDSRFFSEVISEFGGKELDFSDFLKRRFRILAPLVRLISQTGYSDIVPLRPALSNFIRGIFTSRAMLVSAQLVSAVRGYALRKIQRLSELSVDSENLFQMINPDVVLLGNRTKTNFVGREEMYRYFNLARKPVVLLPHGTHEVHPVKEFIPFDEKGSKLAPYCDFWSAFRETPWLNTPGMESQYANVGYPGLDSRWLKYVFERDHIQSNERLNKKCVLVLRKILPKFYARPENYDPFTLDYAEMLEFLNLVGDSIVPLEGKVDLVIKPHPSNNFPLLNQILAESRISNWEISSEPFYQLLPRMDFCISLFSTSLLLPAMCGIPVIVVDTPLQRYVHKRWPILEELYSGLTYFVPQEELGSAVRSAFVSVQSAKTLSSDVSHLRNFYPDQSIEKATTRIRNLLNSRNLEL